MTWSTHSGCNATGGSGLAAWPASVGVTGSAMNSRPAAAPVWLLADAASIASFQTRYRGFVLGWQRAYAHRWRDNPQQQRDALCEAELAVLGRLHLRFLCSGTGA